MQEADAQEVSGTPEQGERRERELAHGDIQAQPARCSLSHPSKAAIDCTPEADTGSVG